MFAFGAVTNKPLSWRGSWKGLRILRTVGLSFTIQTVCKTFLSSVRVFDSISLAEGIGNPGLEYEDLGIRS